jgi:hypothetical protein
MLTGLTIENFKPFGRPQFARLAPITLVYGPNSSGKSSLIQSLLMMRQTLADQDNSSKKALVTSGEFVDLGSFLSLLHKHDKSRKLKFTFRFLEPSFGGKEVDRDGIAEKSRLELTSLSLVYSAKTIAGDDSLPVFSGFSITIYNKELGEFILSFDRNDTDEIFKISQSTDFKALWQILKHQKMIDEHRMHVSSEGNDYKIDHLQPPDPEVFDEPPPEVFDEALALYPEGFDEPPDSFDPFDEPPDPEVFDKTVNTGFIPSQDEIDWLAALEFWSRFSDISFLPNRSSGDFELYSNQPQKFHDYSKILTDFIFFAGRHLKQEIGSVNYLGPLRMHPERIYPSQDLPNNFVGSKGQQVMQILYHDQQLNQQGASLIDRLNEYCQRFEIPYEFSIRSIGEEITGQFIVLSLVDARTGVHVAPTDVGFGISQIMPILVEGMVAQSRSDSRLLCVEQPETHLHPRLQATMADFFIDTACLNAVSENDRKGVQWLLETHSETLVLRLQRRIREGKLSHRDVSVLYVDSRENEGAVIQELRLDEDGEFIDDWPDGFFAEGFNEMFGGA